MNTMNAQTRSRHTAGQPTGGQFATEARGTRTGVSLDEAPDPFPDSAVRDASGDLLVMHHGSAVDFDTFDPEFTGNGSDAWGSGFYFTTDADAARGYGGHVKSATLNITNPIRVDGRDIAHLDQGVTFDAATSANILRAHPDIHRQPDDEDGMNPLIDYVDEFAGREDWSRAELDAMIDKVAAEHFDDVPWSQVEAMFPSDQSDRFRRAVIEATGHDGVMVDFGDDGTFCVAWLPEQIQEL